MEVQSRLAVVVAQIGQVEFVVIYDAVVSQDVRSLVMSLSVIDNFGVGQEQLAFDRLGFWQASLATAIVAREMARNLGASNQEDAFLGGLLADFGKMILDECLREDFERAICLSHEKMISLSSAERRVFGLDHNEVGAQVLSEWNFPERIVDLVGHHECMVWDPSVDADANIAAVVGLAKWGVLGLGIGDNCEILYDWVPADMLSSAHLEGMFDQDLLKAIQVI